MIFLGIDPGKTGGISRHDGNNITAYKFTGATPADVLEGLEFGVALAKLIGTKTDLEMQRVFFIRIASMAIQGIQVLDAEIDAEAEAAQEADDEIPF